MSGATVDLGNIKFNWKGPWANSTAYVVNDTVFSSPHGYVCITANTSHASDPLLATSDSAYWNQMTAGSTTGLPTQTGNADKFLKTDGTTATWETVSHDPTMAGDLTGTASNAQIAADAVGSTEIAAGAVGSTEIAAGAVGSTELANNSVTSDKIGVDVIVAEDIAANAITVAELQDGAVTADKIATGAITSGKIHNSVSMGGPSQGTGSIIRTNADVIDEDIVLASGTNGVTMGPVTITVGRTMTVNGQWKVI